MVDGHPYTHAEFSVTRTAVEVRYFASVYTPPATQHYHLVIILYMLASRCALSFIVGPAAKLDGGLNG